MLQLINYRKHFDSLLVLDIPLLKLEKGIYWFKGSNGAGKTTLLKSCAGLIPFHGEIRALDTDIRKQRKEYLMQVNYAEAEPVYPSFLTGKDLLEFYYKTKGGERKFVEELVKSFGVNSYLQNKVSSYSTGMAKKLSLVLAFIGSPQLILLDEPFITLDIEAVQTLKQLITQKHSSGVSFCISSHQELGLHPIVNTLHIHNKKAELV